MSAEWVTAIATAGTFAVIAASAAAALVQLRHMRGSNQIVALTECRETLESPEFRDAQRFVSYELPRRLNDPAEARKAAQIPFVGEYEAIATVANFFESMGLFVKTGIIDRHIACDFWSFVVLRNWEALLPIISYARARIEQPALWENFEYMAALSERYQREHPTSYPKGAAHMPVDSSLLERAKAWEGEQ
jgi:post-segregation antitoxin (ccd killing protein)